MIARHDRDGRAMAQRGSCVHKKHKPGSQKKRVFLGFMRAMANVEKRAA
jgi:hypothetical protein